MVQDSGAEGIAVIGGEDVATAGIEQAEVDVTAVAGFKAVGLGHEGGFKTVIERNTLDQALEQYGTIAGFYYVMTVAEGDFKLARGALLENGLQRQRLTLCAALHVVEKIGILIKFINGEQLALTGTLTTERRQKRMNNATLGFLAVNKIELQLHCRHWR